MGAGDHTRSHYHFCYLQSSLTHLLLLSTSRASPSTWAAELRVAAAVINREVTWGPEPWFKFLLCSVGRSHQFKSSQGGWWDCWCYWIHLWGIPSPKDDWSVHVGFYRCQPVFSGEAELLKQISHQHFDDFQLLSFSYSVWELERVLLLRFIILKKLLYEYSTTVHDSQSCRG